MTGMKNAPKLAAKKNASHGGDEGARIDAYVGRDALRKCGGVYVISRRDGMVKVGITAEDFSRRFKEVEQASQSAGIVGLQPEILVPMDEGMAEVEAEAHERLSAKREGGEWFRMPAKDAVDAVVFVAMRRRRRNAEGRKMVGLEDASQLTAEERLEWLENPNYEDVIAAALSAVRSIDDADSRAGALRVIAAAQAKARDAKSARDIFAAALSAARSIDDALSRAWALRHIAEAQADAGDVRAARNICAAALSAARSIDNADNRGVLCNIAAMQAAWDMKGAFATARSIDDAFYRADALGDIAAAQAAKGDLDGAFDTVRSIDPERRARALCGIACVQAAERDMKGAFATAKRIGGTGKARDHARVLHDIASAQAKARDLDGALATAQSIDIVPWDAACAWYRSFALCDIASAQAEAGDSPSARNTFADALSTARSFDIVDRWDADNRARVLRYIALARAKAGDMDGAFDTARSIDNAGERADALRGIACAQAAREDMSGAFATARSIDNALRRAGALHDIAVAQAKARNMDGALATALATARSIDDACPRALALSGIAEARAQAGDFRGATKTAIGIEGDGDRARALAAIAGHLAAREKE